jgi:sirohydrochlorin ferrochelatase
MGRLADRVASRWAGPVTAAFLDFDTPSVTDALHQHAGAAPIVVPLLLTSAYHGRVDLPGVVRDSGVAAEITDVLGPAHREERPDQRLVTGLARRVSELECAYDGLVLIAAGTSHAEARSTVDSVAGALSTVFDVPCRVGYASASSPTGAGAAAAVRALGAVRIAAASYFLAAGRLYDAAAASALQGGVTGVAAPLGDAQELAEVVVDRARGVVDRSQPVAA